MWHILSIILIIPLNEQPFRLATAVNSYVKDNCKTKSTM